MNLTLLYITTSDALAAAQGRLPSPTMSLGSFPVLCSLLTLLGAVSAVDSPGEFSTIGNVLKPTITSYTFNPFPTPSESPIPGVFPETYPDKPPPVGNPAVPNFGPAWEAAHSKARTTVSRFFVLRLPLPFKHT